MGTGRANFRDGTHADAHDPTDTGEGEELGSTV